ncbi:adenylate/guanylate cyclase domain-containing protein [Brenneria tiliae]|uniref:adenylate/guanylate cyclase domain-containing protein n=1 Tax=Brenneria tiliae TaxID=2914984 RepID=UPI002014CF8F|nr:adenylate/guanylate cyclase domain-containing protein [Brenneria tiliae]MCL2897008.1 adenylate/guanylate cyclase domain-containing protein [Brenneria tiliae]MCL2901597.1 adenylate/guanylate cyclase domain-containing protein [Brenneria tiliae]
MTAVSVVALVTISLFIVIQLFHFVNQRRDDYARQLEVIAYSVRQPLTEAVLQGEVQRAEDILNNLLPVGFLSRADVLLPDDFQTLHANFPTERPVPQWIARFFKLPIRISVPLYSPPQTQYSTPLAHLVLQADSYRMFQFIVSTFSIMLATYLLLALILSVAITWCMNRLMVYPLRAIITELKNLPAQRIAHHQLTLPAWHQDDEIGALVRCYNRNQQLLEQSLFAAQYELADKAAFVLHLEQWLAESAPFSLMVIGLEPLSADGEGSGVEVYHTLVNQLKAAVNQQQEGRRILLARLDKDEFAVLGRPLASAEQAQAWARNVTLQINAPFTPAGGQSSPYFSGVGLRHVDPSSGKEAGSAALLLAQARLAMQLARHKGNNGIHVFQQ